MEHCTNTSYHHYYKREGEGGVIEELGNGNQPWRTKATHTNKNVLNGDYVLGVPTWKRCFLTPSKCQQDEEEVAKLRRKQLLLLVGCGERRLGRGEFAKLHKKSSIGKGQTLRKSSPSRWGGGRGGNMIRGTDTWQCVMLLGNCTEWWQERKHMGEHWKIWPEK